MVESRVGQGLEPRAGIAAPFEPGPPEVEVYRGLERGFQHIVWYLASSVCVLYPRKGRSWACDGKFVQYATGIYGL